MSIHKQITRFKQGHNVEPTISDYALPHEVKLPLQFQSLTLDNSIDEVGMEKKLRRTLNLPKNSSVKQS